MSSRATRVILARHGETIWNRERKFQGNKNSDLTETGISQAAETGRLLKNVHIDSVYSSPLKRAYNTAEIISGKRNLDIIKRENLREIFLGPWEGKTMEQIEISYPEEYEYFWKKPDKFSISGAETFYELQKRIVAEINNIINENIGKTVLIVSHWIAIKTAAAYYKSIDIESLNCLFNLPNGKFLVMIKGKESILLTDEISYLEQPRI